MAGWETLELNVGFNWKLISTQLTIIHRSSQNFGPHFTSSLKPHSLHVLMAINGWSHAYTEQHVERKHRNFDLSNDAASMIYISCTTMRCSRGS